VGSSPIISTTNPPGQRASPARRPGPSDFTPADRVSALLEVSVRVIADAPVALVDHARAERSGLDQVERDVFGDRRQERRAAPDQDGITEHAQLIDKAELDRRRGQAGAPIETSLSVASSAAVTASATEPSASRALP
jgi:hypothetical protein